MERSLWLLKVGQRFGKLPEEIEQASPTLINHLKIEEWYLQAVAEREGSGT